VEDKKTADAGNKKTVIGELNLDNFKSTIRRDFKELKEFFLDEDRLRKLENKKLFERGLIMAWLLFKGLFLKLTAVRRALLILAVALLVINISGTIGKNDLRFDGYFKIIGGVVLLFILMLELKDKLLAHDELAAGRQVQLALMPESDPKIPGWDVWLYSMPANDVGGDLVDYIKLSEDRYGLALGDVAGKGLSAALFMAKLQATLRALVTEFDSLAGLGAKINQIFHRDSISKSFASLVYLEVKPKSGRINFLNAGHLPPLILRDGKVEFSEKGNLGLGILAKANYKVKRAQLRRGDLFIVYSDGVTEAQNENGDFFGNERLLYLITGLDNPFVSEVGTKILEAVAGFVGEAPRHDDLSLLILKRR
jgi:serine phosphatase RsbU (regulator of sigma subunit)